MLQADLAPLIVTGISFSDTTVEVTYFEKKDQGNRAGLMKNLIIQNDVVMDNMEELLELLNEIVDAGLMEIRNPPETLNPRQRLKTPSAPVEITDDVEVQVRG